MAFYSKPNDVTIDFQLSFTLDLLLMSGYPNSLASVRDLHPQQIQKIIENAFRLKRDRRYLPPSRSAAFSEYNPTMLLAFFEPSTRTRTSFEMAAARLGIRAVSFAADASTSLKKGESAHETLANLLAMKPDLLVCRHGGEKRLAATLGSSKIPWINAGDGKGEHPTQALLDAMTVIEKLGHIEGQKIVYVGDVEHSRVARSGRLLFEMLGAEVAVAAPAEWVPTTADWSKAKKFNNLREASQWCTVCIGLRIQKERHTSDGTNSKGSVAEPALREFRLDKLNLENLSSEAIIMHPGPFVAGEDLNEEILDDPRCVIHDQVTNGVYIRAAVISEMLAHASGEKT